MIRVFDRYILKNLSAATFVTALSLTLIILLTQSIRYLELVIGSDASAGYFLLMMGLAIPKFLEATLPLAFAIGCVFTAQRLINDRESIIMTAAGNSVTQFGRGFFIFTGLMMLIQFALSGWVSPIAVSHLQQTRQNIQSHYATLAFQEGIFNTLGNGLTVYVEKRTGLNGLSNIVIHDANGTLNANKETSIIAKRGIVNITDTTQQILIYDGTQYIKDIKTGQISRLGFERYTLDVPEKDNTITKRWREPDERMMQNLFITDKSPSADQRKKDEFLSEIHKRFSTPLLYGGYILLILYFLFLGEWNRRKMTAPLIKISVAIVILQASYIIMYNEAQDKIILNFGLYTIPFIAILFGTFALYRHNKGRW